MIVHCRAPKLQSWPPLNHHCALDTQTLKPEQNEWYRRNTPELHFYQTIQQSYNTDAGIPYARP